MYQTKLQQHKPNVESKLHGKERDEKIAHLSSPYPCHGMSYRSYSSTSTSWLTECTSVGSD